MNDKAKIIKLSSERWEEYKEIRLEALKSEPLAFGASLEEEEGKPEEYWVHYLNKSLKPGSKWTILFAEAEGKIVGSATTIFGLQKKFQHISRLTGIYVRQGYRGKDIARTLLTEAIQEAFSRPNIEKVKLTVNQTQKPAIALYQSLGFRIVGELKKEFRIDGQFYNAYLMELLKEEFPLT